MTLPGDGMMVPLKTTPFERVANQLTRVDQARKALTRHELELERLVAELVSAKPESPTWYLHPGELTPAEAMGAASLTELQLDRLMARQRARRPKPKRKGGRR